MVGLSGRFTLADDFYLFLGAGEPLAHQTAAEESAGKGLVVVLSFSSNALLLCGGERGRCWGRGGMGR